jgi:hypothetical protein
MHPYVSNVDGRRSLYIVLAAGATVSAFLLREILQSVSVQPPWWIDAPSVLGFFGLYWTVFDHVVWRWRVARWVNWTDAPDLSGSWTATVDTTHEGAPFATQGRVKIRQTASRLSVSIRWDQSRSYSVSGIVQIGGGAEPELIYQYVNEPNPNALATMQIHRGTAWLELVSPTELVGEYYSGRGRRQVGKLSLVRTDGPLHGPGASTPSHD